MAIANNPIASCLTYHFDVGIKKKSYFPHIISTSDGGEERNYSNQQFTLHENKKIIWFNHHRRYFPDFKIQTIFVEMAQYFILRNMIRTRACTF